VASATITKNEFLTDIIRVDLPQAVRRPLERCILSRKEVEAAQPTLALGFVWLGSTLTELSEQLDAMSD